MNDPYALCLTYDVQPAAPPERYNVVLCNDASFTLEATLVAATTWSRNFEDVQETK